MRKIISFTHKGYTLIELIAVVAVFGVVGIIIVSLLFTLLRGSRKADLLTAVRQEGDFTLSQIVRNVRYGQLDSPVSCSSPVTAQSITVTSGVDGGQTTYSCPANQTSPISSNSAALTDNNSVAVTNCSFTCQDPLVGSPPVITIQFTLSPSNGEGAFTENNATVQFDTSVTLRNLK
jgi:prepilin-type N-terminal cleavage/methylation domain-containing protein